ncbi:MAG: DUF4384 domain-containing protein [Sulfurimonas sp.]|uniref:DUF4384 domain-containing protein n=1 Tax=Sulfurimonas sp. TaxID=2022749 RepID=UPI0026386B6D|nr:DUF4384 domain-containing protein [Sulfurimonas sp.]MCW8895893.1 DUF4384 domain-containing protein [Sulfurimonas sp.]MCW8954913.1 DUF4384 domain-containing protein [Sulfurimonas sp.]MCW9067577.1 DUF4384 domain-containing protein [Sulfurimonas sp.]
MIRITLLILLTITLCIGEEGVIKKDSNNKQRLFRGVSDWYPAEDIAKEHLAGKSATQNAYALISKYFGISIKSHVELNNSQNNTKTDQLILSLKAFKTYKEVDENKKNFRVHVIIFLDEKNEKTILDKIKDEQEFNELKKNILASIDKKKYSKAKKLLNLAKEKQSAKTDESIIIIEKRLNTIIDSLLHAKIILSKKSYVPDESIEVEVSLNQDGYLYLFYETGLDVAMIFPNEKQRVPRLQKDESLFFPNENVENLTAYKDDLGREVKFYAIASKAILPIKSLSEERVDGVYIYEKTGSYKKLLNKCLKEDICTKSEINFKVSNTIE